MSVDLELLNNCPQFSVPGTEHIILILIPRQFVPFLFCIASGVSVSL